MNCKHNKEKLNAKIRWAENIVKRGVFDPFTVFALYKLEKWKKLVNTIK
jgi:hypothetical protein